MTSHRLGRILYLRKNSPEKSKKPTNKQTKKQDQQLVWGNIIMERKENSNKLKQLKKLEPEATGKHFRKLFQQKTEERSTMYTS